VNAHEEAFVRSFIVPKKRDRYLRLLGHPKHRAKLLDRLNHNLDLYARQPFTRAKSLQVIRSQN
jgi:hypothetical protein